MGDPRKSKKKFDKPKYPWQMERLEEERKVVNNYGLKNKKELWRMETLLRGFRRQARKLQALHTAQAKKEEELLLERLRKLKLLEKDSKIDDILALKLENVLDRRLQTLVFKKGMANTPRHARQFIIHGHISIKGGKVTAPSYLVKRDEEDSVSYSEFSPIKNQTLQSRKQEKVEGEA